MRLRLQHCSTHLAAPARAAGDLIHRRVDALSPVLLRVGGCEGVPAVAPVPPAPAGEAPPPLRPPGPPWPRLLTPDAGQRQAEAHPGQQGHTSGAANALQWSISSDHFMELSPTTALVKRILRAYPNPEQSIFRHDTVGVM